MHDVDELAFVVGEEEDPLAGLSRENVRKILTMPLTAAEGARLAMARVAPRLVREFILKDIIVRRRLNFESQNIKETDMTEDADKQKGTIRAFLNPDKVPGDDKPAFTGALKFPGEEKERNFALWSRKDKNGAMILSGYTSVVSGSAMEQITGLTPDGKPDKVEKLTVGKGAKPLTLDPRDIVLFENKNKGDKRPDFYGWHHTGEKGREPLQVAVWAKVDSNDRAYITGNMQEPAPDQQQEQDAEPEMAQ
jgi:hypothetical protein